MIGTTIPVEQGQAVGDMLTALIVSLGFIFVFTLGYSLWLIKRYWLDVRILEKH